MKKDICSSIFDPFTTIKRIEFHCQKCGSIYYMAVPNEMNCNNEEVEYYKKLAKHYHDSLITLETIIKGR